MFSHSYSKKPIQMWFTREIAGFLSILEGISDGSNQLTNQFHNSCRIYQCQCWPNKLAEKLLEIPQHCMACGVTLLWTTQSNLFTKRRGIWNQVQQRLHWLQGKNAMFYPEIRGYLADLWIWNSLGHKRKWPWQLYNIINISMSIIYDSVAMNEQLQIQTWCPLPLRFITSVNQIYSSIMTQQERKPVVLFMNTPSSIVWKKSLIHLML